MHSTEGRGTTEETTDGSPWAGPSRRALLIGAGSVGTMALLAACGDDEPTRPTGMLPGAAGDDLEPSDEPADEPADDPADEEEGVDLGPASDVPVGGGHIYADDGVVVTQPAAGEYRSFTNICSHMQCPVANVANGRINCTCHGSQFSIEDGAVLNPPALRPLQRRGSVTEVAGRLKLT